MQYFVKSIIFALALLLVACSANPLREDAFEAALSNMEKMTRWNEFAGIVNLIDPEYLAENPISELDISRLSQFRVTGYSVAQKDMNADNTVYLQLVVLQLYNTHNPVERRIRWPQEWRYNPETRRWTMFSGLPDLRQP